MKLRQTGSKFFSFGINAGSVDVKVIDKLAKIATHTPEMNILIFQRWQNVGP